MNRPLLQLILLFFSGWVVAGEFHDAADAGDAAKLKALLGQNRDIIHQKDKAGNQALHLAALKGHVEIIQSLLASGADVNAKGFDDMTPLHYAAKSGNRDACLLLLEHGADRDAVNGVSRTPQQMAMSGLARTIQGFVPKMGITHEVFQAIEAADLLRVKTIIAAGADALKARDDAGRTPLLLAARRNDTDMVRLILESGADVNSRDRNGHSALYFACDAPNTEIIRLLFQFKIKPAYEREFNEHLEACLSNAAPGATADAFAKMPSMLSIGKAEQTVSPEIIAMLEKFASQPPPQDARDIPAEKRARYLAAAGLLIEMGVDVNLPDSTGSTAFAIGARAETPHVLNALLAWGAKPDNPDARGPQPLAWAVVTGRTESISRLLKAGSDPLFKPQGQESALGVAGRFGDLAAAKTLLEAVKDRARLKKDDSALRAAARRGHAEIVRLFLEAGMPVNKRDVHEMTPLHEAVRSDSAEVTLALLKAGADVNARDKAGYTPLHNAAESSKSQHVPVLLQHGADIEITTLEGFTPFMIAAEGDLETMKLLMKAGARIDRFAVTGFNALHVAASKGSAKAVNLLLEAGIPVDTPTRHSGSTALHLAANGGGLMRERFKNNQEINGMKLSEPQYGDKSDYLQTVETLLQAGAKVSSVSKEGLTPLHLAAQYDQTEIARVLLAKGADVNARTMLGLTALQLAVHTGNKNMADLLRKHGTR